MFGLEQQPKEPFQFDLETDIKTDPAKAKEILKSVDERMARLKQKLREGAETDDFDEFGVLLHGYTALQRIIGRILKNK